MGKRRRRAPKPPAPVKRIDVPLVDVLSNWRTLTPVLHALLLRRR